jgi:hypothetical protein
MFSVVYGKINHVFNRAITDCSKRRRGSVMDGIVAAWDRGIVRDRGRISPQFPTGLVNPQDDGSTL